MPEMTCTWHTEAGTCVSDRFLALPAQLSPIYALLNCILAPLIQAQSRQSLPAVLPAQESSEARFEAKARVLLEERRDFKEKVGSNTRRNGNVYIRQRPEKNGTLRYRSDTEEQSEGVRTNIVSNIELFSGDLSFSDRHYASSNFRTEPDIENPNSI
jgi:hypothetical protein